MGVTKTAHFTEKQNEMASLIKAIGHPARIAIIEYLIKVDSCICGDIVNELPLAQATISQHLKELKVILKVIQFVIASMKKFGLRFKIISVQSP